MDSGTDPERESRLLHHMGKCIQILENSLFWISFLTQMQTPEFVNQLLEVLGGETNMQMVVYGIGSISNGKDPRLQLSLALLMKRTFNWIGEIEVFDPVISLIESNVITALGCSVLSVDEECRREVTKPTFFFMPHCNVSLFGNLLQANWKPDMLNRVVILGNSFENFVNRESLRGIPDLALSLKYLRRIRHLTKEFKIKTIEDDSHPAFRSMSWHFFYVDSEEKLVFFNDYDKFKD